MQPKIWSFFDFGTEHAQSGPKRAKTGPQGQQRVRKNGTTQPMPHAPPVGHQARRTQSMLPQLRGRAAYGCFGPMPTESFQCPAVFSKDIRTTMEAGQWALYWKQAAPSILDAFKVLGCWDNVAYFQKLASLAKEAEICLTQPITCSVAEGSFRALKGLLSSDRQALS
uniref:Uncharacterized protein n=1 Tax=Eutreptiella gymnastica TaxID=73025 RepID=A0A7S1NVT4_9EUGL|mmetsp:Transcript_98518/g.169745  ORF Transcript_98518/g.169745 Transcript_98518/m.169745 type:complete len:168 (+) Transcript_98518:1-504(+)